MDARSSQRFRPGLERLDSILSTSTVSASHVRLPKQGLTDLRSTQITTDLRDALIRTTPHDGRQGWSLRVIKVDPTTRTVYGGVTLLYRAKPFSGFFVTFKDRVKLKVDIAFATNLDNPKPGDVLVSPSRSLNSFGPNVRKTMALGIVTFLKTDHDLIAAKL